VVVGGPWKTQLEDENDMVLVGWGGNQAEIFRYFKIEVEGGTS